VYASILNLTFDCTGASVQAAFWAVVTGWTASKPDPAIC